MKRILWLSNVRFASSEAVVFGSWTDAMGRALIGLGDYEILNVTMADCPDEIQECNHGVRQWVLPTWYTKGDSLLSSRLTSRIREIVLDAKPDIIHVWGTENDFGLITASGIFDCPVLLEIQGLRWTVVPHMMGGLTLWDSLRCLGIKELLKPSLYIPLQQMALQRRTPVEQQIISGHRYIDTQSDWVRNQIAPCVQNAKIFNTRMMLRDEFLKCEPWKWQDQSPVIFSSCGLSLAKGVHVLFRALAIVKKRYPLVVLELTDQIRVGARCSGHVKWLARLISGLGIEENVRFVGRLDANRMVEHLQNCSVAVYPSLVESYSMSTAEMLAVGAPTVLSYAGAMPEVARPDVDAMFAPILDPGALAAQIIKLLSSKDLCDRLSKAAVSRSRSMHGRYAAAKRQSEIYNEVIAISKGN